MYKQVEFLFKKKMSRRDFLILVGLGLLTILGISSRLKDISNLIHPTPKVTSGFGGGAYGK